MDRLISAVGVDNSYGFSPYTPSGRTLGLPPGARRWTYDFSIEIVYYSEPEVGEQNIPTIYAGPLLLHRIKFH